MVDNPDPDPDTHERKGRTLRLGIRIAVCIDFAIFIIVFIVEEYRAHLLYEKAKKNDTESNEGITPSSEANWILFFTVLEMMVMICQAALVFAATSKTLYLKRPKICDWCAKLGLLMNVVTALVAIVGHLLEASNKAANENDKAIYYSDIILAVYCIVFGVIIVYLLIRFIQFLRVPDVLITIAPDNTSQNPQLSLSSPPEEGDQKRVSETEVQK